MMLLMILLSWVGMVIVALFATLCIAAGLFYLAELVEEYTVMTRKFLALALVVGDCALPLPSWGRVLCPVAMSTWLEARPS